LKFDKIELVQIKCSSEKSGNDDGLLFSRYRVVGLSPLILAGFQVAVTMRIPDILPEDGLNVGENFIAAKSAWK